MTSVLLSPSSLTGNWSSKRSEAGRVTHLDVPAERSILPPADISGRRFPISAIHAAATHHAGAWSARPPESPLASSHHHVQTRPVDFRRGGVENRRAHHHISPSLANLGRALHQQQHPPPRGWGPEVVGWVVGVGGPVDVQSLRQLGDAAPWPRCVVGPAAHSALASRACRILEDANLSAGGQPAPDRSAHPVPVVAGTHLASSPLTSARRRLAWPTCPPMC